MLFPIVLLCDEMVMGKLPKQQHTLWFLLQSELYKINYGGDVFYDFVDERLTKPDTPAMVFEVLYYCLSVGFVGKFDDDGGKVQRYKALLSERIPGAFTPLRKKKRRREAREAEAVALAAPTPVAAAAGSGWGAVAWYYLVTVGLMVLAVGVVLALSNL